MTRLSTATRRFTATSNSDTQGSAESRRRRCTRRCASVFLCLFMPPPASRLPGFPASPLFCFPAFWLPSPFSLSLPPSSFPSFPSVPPSPLFAAFAGASGFLSALDGMAWERSMPGCRLASACRFFGGGLRGYPGFRPLSDGMARERLLARMPFGSCPSLGRFADIPAPAPPDGAVGALTGFRCELRRGSARRLWRDFGASRGVVPFGGWRGYGDGTTGHEKKRRPQCGERRLRFALYRSGRAKRPFGSSPEWGGRPPGRVGLSVWASGCGAFQRPGRAQTWRRDRRT